ncbi:hypothetical protein ColTof3_01229 [Colletotrichum tofieldiae]|nr:hypothetical protein ColTof3_01229 [Colletotrichum tofieldiae]GKT95577.1 hypothetical protein Ct61P_13427 [Colletotrichum tofieldiae]
MGVINWGVSRGEVQSTAVSGFPICSGASEISGSALNDDNPYLFPYDDERERANHGEIWDKDKVAQWQPE